MERNIPTTRSSERGTFIRETVAESVMTISEKCSGVTKGEGTQGGGRPPRSDTLQGVTPEAIFLWANLRRIVDKRGRTGKKVRGDTLQEGDTRLKSIKVTVMSKKGSSVFQKKIKFG